MKKWGNINVCATAATTTTKNIANADARKQTLQQTTTAGDCNTHKCQVSQHPTTTNQTCLRGRFLPRYLHWWVRPCQTVGFPTVPNPPSPVVPKKRRKTCSSSISTISSKGLSGSTPGIKKPSIGYYLKKRNVFVTGASHGRRCRTPTRVHGASSMSPTSTSLWWRWLDWIWRHSSGS